MRYQPALDGVRAVAVVMVLLFHAQVGWMPGGYLGVSVFFTLSGYLITSLLLSERAATGRVDIRRFYVRRIRRLLPASLLTLAGVGVLVAVGTIDARSTFRDDVLAALFQLKNWSTIATEESYADLFARSSPLDHFWSLSIEEQFYLVWPLTIAGMAVWAARSVAPARHIAIACLALFTAAAASAPVTAALASTNVVYLASWTRFAEILAGAALAAALAGRTAPRWIGFGAPVGLAAIVVLGVVSPAAGGWAYAGRLPLFAVLSVATLAGLQVPGHTRMLLSWSPIVWIGRVSYGLYLYHWPVYVVLDEPRTGLDGWRLLVVRLGVTVAVAALSAHLIELPIRRGQRIGSDRRLIAGVATAVAVVAATVVVVVPASSPASTALAVEREVPPVASRAPLQVVLLGDSVAHTLAGGVVDDWPWEPWDPSQSVSDPEVIDVVSVAEPACSFLAGDIAPVRLDGTRRRADLSRFCGEWRTNTDAALAAAGPGAFLVVVLTNDVHDRWGSDGELVPLGSASWTALLDAFMAEVRGIAAAHDADVVVVGLSRRTSNADEGERDRRLATVLADYAAGHDARYLDFGPAIDARPELRSDGLHYTREGAEVFSQWLAIQLPEP